MCSQLCLCRSRRWRSPGPAPPVQLDLSTLRGGYRLFPAGAAAKGAAVFQSAAAGRRGMPKGPGAAAGAGRVSGPVPACGAAPSLRSWRGQGSAAGGCWPRCCPARRQWTLAHPPEKVLENNGVSCCCLRVDREGMSVQVLEDLAAAVCYVTPSDQFPTESPCGPPPDRAAAWAARGQGRRLIIEDDYDSEFRFDTRRCPACRAWRGRMGRWCICPPAPGPDAGQNIRL